MTLVDMPYVPTGAWWRRAWEALRIAVGNVQARLSERRERHHEERLEHWKRD